MRRSALLMGIGLVVLLALAGCSSKEDKKQSHFTQGKEYFDKGEFKAAKIELKNAIQMTRSSPRPICCWPRRA